MITKFNFTYLFAALLFLILAGCTKEGPAGKDATVYYSEWFYPPEWSGGSGDWYYVAPAPDLTKDIVEHGVILAYAWLEGDAYKDAVRPLPAYAVGANWSFLISEYGSIEFTCDMVELPATEGNSFRFVAIPGTKSAAKSASATGYSEQDLRKMSYKQICELFDIPIYQRYPK